MRGESIQIPLNAGHHRTASKTSLKWRFAGGPMMANQWRLASGPMMTHKWRFAGRPMMAQHWILAWWLYFFFQWIRTSIAKKPFSFVIFQGGGGGPSATTPPPSPLWIRAKKIGKSYLSSESMFNNIIHWISLVKSLKRRSRNPQTTEYVTPSFISGRFILEM